MNAKQLIAPAAALLGAAAVLLAACAAMWIRGAGRLRKTPEYAAWKSGKRAGE